MEARISMLGLGVADLEKSKNFYAALGWEVSERSTDSIVFIRLKGIVLCLYGMQALAEDCQLGFEELPAFRGQSIAYNCRSKEDVDANYKKVLSLGATSLKAPQDTFWGGYGAYFKDLDGHVWELAYNPFAEFDEQGHLQF